MIKKRNPEFIRQDARNIKSLKVAWRKPRGMHSKVRMSILGHRPRVKIGYRNPAIIRNTRHNLPLLHISNSKELEAAPQLAAIIFAARLGMKKKEVLIRRAQEKGLTILNLKPESFLERIKNRQQKSAAPAAKAAQQDTQQDTKTKEKSQSVTTPQQPQPLSEKEAEKKIAAEKRKVLEKPK